MCARKSSIGSQEPKEKGLKVKTCSSKKPGSIWTQIKKHLERISKKQYAQHEIKIVNI